MECKLLFVRHGQSLGNLNGVFLGVTDLDLSPLGYSQAECTAEYLKLVHIDAIYSSDLLRAYNTSLPTAKNHNLSVIKSQKLREIYAGDWENKKFDSLITDYPDTYGLWKSDIGKSRAKNGESVVEVQNRVVEEVTKIAEQNLGKTVAIFTHATPIRTFFCYAYGQTIDYMKEMHWVSNASVSEAIYKDGKFTAICYGYDDFMNNIKTELPKNC